MKTFPCGDIPAEKLSVFTVTHFIMTHAYIVSWLAEELVATCLPIHPPFGSLNPDNQIINPFGCIKNACVLTEMEYVRQIPSATKLYSLPLCRYFVTNHQNQRL